MQNSLSKQVFLLLGASVIAILFLQQWHIVVNALATAHQLVSEGLALIFAGGKVGSIFRAALGLLCVPLIFGATVGGAYWLLKRRPFPYLNHTIWTTWLIIAVSMAWYQ